jgi:formamidopyrimidine-DNA glycosylase
LPELPEVQTTVNGLNKYVKNLTIKDVWTDFHSQHSMFKETVKNPEYFLWFKKNTKGSKILKSERRGKNILINLSNNKVILVHLKMTGHLLDGTYSKEKTKNTSPSVIPAEAGIQSQESELTWIPAFARMTDSKSKKIEFKWIAVEPESLKDPFNRFVHLVFTLSNGKHLALCDARKFSKVVLLETENAHHTKHLKDIGPEPLHKNFTWAILKNRLTTKLNTKIKTALIDPSIVAGIGNIYSDEALWLSSIHPERLAKNITDKEMQKLFKSIQAVLTKGIDFGGDSMSDYRNILGLPGKFHHEQNVYQKKNEKCGKKGCGGIIKRIVVRGRSTHFCPTHQK